MLSPDKSKVGCYHFPPIAKVGFAPLASLLKKTPFPSLSLSSISSSPFLPLVPASSSSLPVCSLPLFFYTCPILLVPFAASRPGPSLSCYSYRPPPPVTQLRLFCLICYYSHILHHGMLSPSCNGICFRRRKKKAILLS